MSRLSKEQVEQYLTIIGENSYPAEAAELRWHIEALDKYNYSQWERGYGDGITGMGAALAGAPLENLPEANREQARRWIDRHDAELKAQTAAVMEKAATECDRHAEFCKREADNGGDRDHLMARYAEANWNAQKIRALIPADYAAALNAMMVAAVDRGFQAGQKEMAERVREAVREARINELKLVRNNIKEHKYRVDCQCYPCIAIADLELAAASPVSEQAGAPEREQP